jgi:hypothetical protein
VGPFRGFDAATCLSGFGNHIRGQSKLKVCQFALSLNTNTKTIVYSVRFTTCRALTCWFIQKNIWPQWRLARDEIACFLQLPDDEVEFEISPVFAAPSRFSSRFVSCFLRNVSSALKLTGLVMKWSIPEFHASSFALADAKPVKAIIVQRGILYSCSYCRMARVADMPSMTGIDISTISN